MRLYKSKKFYLLFTLALILISCKKEKQVVQLLPEDRQWILDSMQVYYYWADQLPNYPLSNGSSISFFKSLLHSSDRFSYIEDPENLPSTYSSFAYYGFEYALMESTAFPGRLLGIITLVVPNGPAAKRGLKRGDIFTAVNGVELSNTTIDKINQLLKLGGEITIQTFSIENGQLVSKASYVISYAYFREQPVYLTKLFTNGNKKVGYVFYNGFYEEFDRNILDSISKFKNGGISDLILDLRYNPGGAVSSAAKIAAAIAPVSETQTFIISKANKNGGQFIETFAQSINKGNTYPGNFSQVSAFRINIHTLYVLTSGTTASSAELIINNLRPYLPIVQIGNKTLGKDMSSFEIFDQRKPKKVAYILHPLIFKLYNANHQGDYSEGLRPDYEVDEFSVLPLKAFGDTNDPLLKKALEISLGTVAVSTLSKTSSALIQTTESMKGKAMFQSSVIRSGAMPIVIMEKPKSLYRFNQIKK